MKFRTIVADPPWKYSNRATRGAATNHYETAELHEMPASLPALDDAHLYLWVTNAFMVEGHELAARWGFKVKTILTWVKPQIGLGNYFRNNTEHVLFAVKGKLPTQRKNCPTAFHAPRDKHSRKPDAFYDLVESMSPGPYLDVFARSCRLGWAAWGNEWYEEVAV